MADAKITALTATTSVASTDILPVVTNPGTTPLTQKITVANFFTSPTIVTPTLTSPVIATITNSGTLTLPTSTDTLIARATTDTLTNKRITKRVLSLSAGSATPSINTDLYDVVHITAQTAAITSFTTNLSGAPVQGDTLRIDITDDGTARALSWGTSFESSAVTLPTTTILSQRMDIDFVWNTVTSKWRCKSITSTSSSGGGTLVASYSGGGSSTTSASLANITGATVSITTTVTSQIFLVAHIAAYAASAIDYYIRWHNGTSSLAQQHREDLRAGSARSHMSAIAIEASKAAGSYTYTLQHLVAGGVSATAETVDLILISNPV